jgi:YesN/AraC family two-component response regulator
MSVKRPALLVVDDDQSVRESYVLIFEETMDVTEAGNATAALEAVGRQRFDVIFLDIRMPGISGMEAFASIRAAQPETPIVFVSALADTDTAMRAIRLGAFDYVTKPFDMDALTTLADRAVASRSELVSLVGEQVGLAAAATVLAAARGVPVAVGPARGTVRLVQTDGKPLEAIYAEAAPRAPRLTELIARVATYVGTHHVGVKVDRIAEAVGVSPDRLSRVFREETTLTARDFVTRVRIEVARYLLRESRDSLEVIARRVGLCVGPRLDRARDSTDTSSNAYRASGFPPEG